MSYDVLIIYVIECETVFRIILDFGQYSSIIILQVII